MYLRLGSPADSSRLARLSPRQYWRDSVSVVACRAGHASRGPKPPEPFVSTVNRDTRLSARDVGKRVVDGSGELVGCVVEFSAGSAHVDPDSDVFVASDEGGSRRDEDTFRINDEQVEKVTDTEVLLRS